MYANHNELSSKNSSGSARKGGWLMGGALAIAAAIGLTLVIRNGSAKPAAEPVSIVQSVPDAAAQGVQGYIQAHQGNSSLSVQVVPDAGSQGVAGYISAHGPRANPQSVPDAAAQSVLAYLQAHGAGPSASVQLVPDANTQSVLAYLAAHAGQPSLA